MEHTLRVLFLSFYYSPDLCAGSFRNTPLVNALLKQLPAGSHIHVVTTLPTRYSSFSVEAPDVEIGNGFTINRIRLPAHKSGMIDQSIAFLTFAREAVRRSQKADYDLVYASSSRLMTAVLGSFLARRKGLPLYLDIRDIFVDTIKDVLPSKFALITKPLFSFLEHWAFSRAQRINLVSEGFRGYYEKRFPRQSLSFFTNGIDDVFLAEQPDRAYSSEADILEIVYAGNFGEGQGLHSIIPELAKAFEGRLKFTLLGDGGRKAQLIKALAENAVKNVELLAPVSRDQLLKVYKRSDILFLHLNDYDAFLKVLPSKLFEYAAIGKPIWAGVSGYAAQFALENIDNVAVFPPCDVKSAQESFQDLLLETKPRNDFCKKFSRSNIMEKMAQDIIATEGGGL
jgi:glycosyltransferase involved in cell wall biosynthesis